MRLQDELYAVWFVASWWLGAIVNIALGVFLLIAPDTLLGWFGLPLTRDAMGCAWPRSSDPDEPFLLPVGRDPFRYRAAAWLPVLARVAGAVFFFAAFLRYFLFGRWS